MISSSHPHSPSTSEESFQGNPTVVTSQWEEGTPPVLFCRNTTIGKSDVSEQRSRVLIDGATGKPHRLVVETKFTKEPGAPEVVYVRIYEPLVEGSV